MTDQDLLKLAATAAGIELLDWRDSWADYPGPAWRTTQRELWNPLIDDGDAFRLLVAMRRDLGFEKLHTVSVFLGDDWLTEHCVDGMGADILQATRRAIVRAAAEMGKAMP